MNIRNISIRSINDCFLCNFVSIIYAMYLYILLVVIISRDYNDKSEFEYWLEFVAH
jgi:hypothetical protein